MEIVEILLRSAWQDDTEPESDEQELSPNEQRLMQVRLARTFRGRARRTPRNDRGLSCHLKVGW